VQQVDKRVLNQLADEYDLSTALPIPPPFIAFLENSFILDVQYWRSAPRRLFCAPAVTSLPWVKRTRRHNIFVEILIPCPDSSRAGFSPLVPSVPAGPQEICECCSITMHQKAWSLSASGGFAPDSLTTPFGSLPETPVIGLRYIPRYARQSPCPQLKCCFRRLPPVYRHIYAHYITSP